MTGPMNDQKLPDGQCHGRDLPDRGSFRENADQYGVDDGAANRGFTSRQTISGNTGSDGKQEGRK